LCDPVAVIGHFRLIEPASWLIESDRGDPQKTGPCGGSNTDWGKPSYAVTKATGGQQLHIKLLETIYHPGHYRVALAVNSPTELPPDPETATRDGERGPVSVSAKIQEPPQAPVIADGLFVHAARPTGQAAPFETDVQLPNITCRKCTLQVVQFMAEHAFNNPGGVFMPPLRRAAESRPIKSRSTGLACRAITTHSRAAARPSQLCLQRHQR
jgi:hypothetical protein